MLVWGRNLPNSRVKCFVGINSLTHWGWVVVPKRWWEQLLSGERRLRSLGLLLGSNSSPSFIAQVLDVREIRSRHSRSGPFPHMWLPHYKPTCVFRILLISKQKGSNFQVRMSVTGVGRKALVAKFEVHKGCSLLWCYTVSPGKYLQRFRLNVLPPSPWYRSSRHCLISEKENLTSGTFVKKSAYEVWLLNNETVCTSIDLEFLSQK